MRLRRSSQSGTSDALAAPLLALVAFATPFMAVLALTATLAGPPQAPLADGDMAGGNSTSPDAATDRDAHESHGINAVDQWSTGMIFDVLYEIPTVRRPQRPGGPAAGEPLLVRAVHRVVGRSLSEGRERVTMAVALDEVHVAGGGRAYTLTLDVATRGLVALEEHLPDGRIIVHENHYAVGGPEAMLFPPRRLPLIIADLPRLPAAPPDTGRTSRTIQRLDELLPPFEQSIARDTDGAFVVELERTDPDSGRIHRSTQRWQAGEPWWREARVTLGDELIIVGHRVVPDLPRRLWLPWATSGDVDGGDGAVRAVVATSAPGAADGADRANAVGAAGAAATTATGRTRIRAASPAR